MIKNRSRLRIRVRNLEVTHFNRPGGKNAVYWLGAQTSLQKVAALQPQDEVCDLMGNPVSPPEVQPGGFSIDLLRATKKMTPPEYLTFSQSARSLRSCWKGRE